MTAMFLHVLSFSTSGRALIFLLRLKSILEITHETGERTRRLAGDIVNCRRDGRRFAATVVRVVLDQTISLPFR